MSKTWFNVKAQAENPDESEVYIFDEIGGWGVMASALIAAWPKSAKIVCVKINSPGGEVMEGMAIYNFLQEQKKTQEVVCRVEGVAASMASIVAIGGSVVEMSENSLMMIHNPWGITAGDSEEMRKTAEILEKMGEILVGTYCAKTGKSADEIKKMMDDETWMTAKEAVEMKFADKIVNSLNAKLSALIDPFRAKLNEGRLVAAMAKAEPPPQANPPPAQPPKEDGSAELAQARADLVASRAELSTANAGLAAEKARADKLQSDISALTAEHAEMKAKFDKAFPSEKNHSKQQAPAGKSSASVVCKNIIP